jgi:hypothetical protein
MGMKMKLALAAAAILGAVTFTAPTSAAPLAGTGLAAKADTATNAVEQVHRRRWRGHRYYGRRHWRPRHYGYRPFRRYRPYYYGYPGYYGYYGYPYRRWYRPGVYLHFGW